MIGLIFRIHETKQKIAELAAKKHSRGFPKPPRKGKKVIGCAKKTARTLWAAALRGAKNLLVSWEQNIVKTAQKIWNRRPGTRRADEIPPSENHCKTVASRLLRLKRWVALHCEKTYRNVRTYINQGDQNISFLTVLIGLCISVLLTGISPAETVTDLPAVAEILGSSTGPGVVESVIESVEKGGSIEPAQEDSIDRMTPIEACRLESSGGSRRSFLQALIDFLTSISRRPYDERRLPEIVCSTCEDVRQRWDENKAVYAEMNTSFDRIQDEVRLIQAANTEASAHKMQNTILDWAIREIKLTEPLQEVMVETTRTIIDPNMKLASSGALGPDAVALARYADGEARHFAQAFFDNRVAVDHLEKAFHTNAELIDLLKSNSVDENLIEKARELTTQRDEALEVSKLTSQSKPPTKK